MQSAIASFNGSDGDNGTLITLPTAYTQKCLFAWGNDVFDGAKVFGVKIVDAGHVRIFGRFGTSYENATMNLMTIGF